MRSFHGKPYKSVTMNKIPGIYIFSLSKEISIYIIFSVLNPFSFVRFSTIFCRLQ